MTMDILSELRSQAEQAEVLDVQSESTPVGFEANRLKSSPVEETRGTAIRVVVDGRVLLVEVATQLIHDVLTDLIVK